MLMVSSSKGLLTLRQRNEPGRNSGLSLWRRLDANSAPLDLPPSLARGVPTLKSTTQASLCDAVRRATRRYAGLDKLLAGRQTRVNSLAAGRLRAMDQPNGESQDS